MKLANYYKLKEITLPNFEKIAIIEKYYLNYFKNVEIVEKKYKKYNNISEKYYCEGIYKLASEVIVLFSDVGIIFENADSFKKSFLNVHLRYLYINKEIIFYIVTNKIPVPENEIIYRDVVFGKDFLITVNKNIISYPFWS